MVVDSTLRWNLGDRISVFCMNGTSGQKEVLHETIEEWIQNIDLNFEITDDPAAVIRVRFGSVLFSSIGRDALNVPVERPTLMLSDLGKPMKLQQYILHEFGHVLGCHHEHQSPNFPYSINMAHVTEKYTSMPYGWSTSMIQKNFARLQGDQIQASDFDSDSIMMYGLTSDEVVGGTQFSYNQELSTEDKNFIRQAYQNNPI